MIWKAPDIFRLTSDNHDDIRPGLWSLVIQALHLCRFRVTSEQSWFIHLYAIHAGYMAEDSRTELEKSCCTSSYCNDQAIYAYVSHKFNGASQSLGRLLVPNGEPDWVVKHNDHSSCKSAAHLIEDVQSTIDSCRAITRVVAKFCQCMHCEVAIATGSCGHWELHVFGNRGTSTIISDLAHLTR